MSAPPSQAAFPGQDGKIAYTRAFEGQPTQIWSVNPDGTELTQLTEDPISSFHPAWSPDGARIAFERFEDSFTDGIWVMNADGTGETRVASGYDPSWSPDGAKLVFYRSGALRVMNADGTGEAPIVNSVQSNPVWSPDGGAIATDGIRRFDADGSNETQLTAEGGDPSWSPDGSRILFEANQAGGGDLYLVNRDGTGLTPLSTGPNPEHDPAFSPSGTRIAYQGNGTRSIVVMNADGTNRAAIAPDAWNLRNGALDWQPIPVSGYARPKGASPVHAALVPAFAACTAPDRTHGPPLAFGSCAPPRQTSSQLTVGTPDANARPAKSTGYVRYDVVAGDPATPADEADVQLAAVVNDVRNAGTLSDYTAALSVEVGLRVTDKDNTPHPGGPGAATGSDASFAFSVPCAGTADTTVGSTCAVTTSADAVVAGAVRERRRAIWQLGRVEVHDGSGTLFLTQGLFVP